MANEYLQRTPTSTGNRRVWTWSGWVKQSKNSANQILWSARPTSTPYTQFQLSGNNSTLDFYDSNAPSSVVSTQYQRDFSSWYNIIISVDTTQTISSNRVIFYLNGVRVNSLSTATFPNQNDSTNINALVNHTVGRLQYDNSQFLNSQLTDVFFIDGQALTPDVFGFYKPGKGYISAGSTQATDFRNGQWVPRKPSSIIQEINDEGGFGVNGFYLPMNDSNNFGADFHCDPNSIITLNEKLPQPRVGVANTATAGIGFTDALRADPYAANLVLAIPGVIGGQGSGYGDYSANIKGSGSNKTVTAVGNAGVAVTASYYGSALIFDGSGDYFTSVNSSDFYFNGDFTVEFWVYRNVTSTSETLVGVFENSVARRSWQIETRTNSALRFEWFSDGSSSSNITTANNSVPGSQWNHIAMVKRNNTITGYVNGVAAGINTNAGAIYQNTVDPLRIGVLNAAEDQDFNGYIQDLRIYKGVAKYTGGFDVPKPYTPVGIATWRAVPDTCQNNFATLNPLIEARPSSATDSPSNSTLVTFAGGNLDLTNSGSAGNAQRMYSFGTIGISTGRWYWEVRAGSNDAVAISKGFQQKSYGAFLGSGSGIEASVGYLGGGSVSIANTAYYSTATTLTPPTFDTTNIIGIAVSANNGLNNLTVQWFKDGVSVVTLTGVGATSSVLEWFPSRLINSSGSGGDTKYNFGQNPTFSGNVSVGGTFTDSNGKGLFKYQPPAGFLALCEDNLPKPTIEDPGKYFKTVLYTGDGNSGRSIVGVGFTPDLVWTKERNTAFDHAIYDSVRGAARYLPPNVAGVETVDTTSLLSFNADGFTLGNWAGENVSGTNYVAWCWKAGGAAVVNTNGTISSQVSANQTAGFSIVSWTGNGSSTATVGHGLGKTPSFIICKRRSSASDWLIKHKSLSSQNNLLFTTVAQTNVTSAFSSGGLGDLSSSSTFGFLSGTVNANNVNENNGTFIAYCWAEIEGFSKFGSYVGNGSADGPFVYCGFKPAFVMIKRTDGGTENWIMFDNARKSVNDGDQRASFANLSDAEGTGWPIDFVSNGFKNRYTGSTNTSGATYIFVAFAESPFTTANAK